MVTSLIMMSVLLPDADRYKIKAYVAADFTFNDPVVLKINCTCGGTGFVTVNDGGTPRRVACPCGANCKCKKTGQSGESPELLVLAVGSVRGFLFTSPGCPGCEVIKKNAIPALVKQGWKVGPDAANHIRIFNSAVDDEANFKYNIKVLPTYIIYRDDREVFRWEASKNKNSLTASEIADAYNKEVAKKPVTTSQTTLYLGVPWLLNGRNTPLEHLINEDHPYRSRYSYKELSKVKNNPDILNRIHGYAHTGRAVSRITVSLE